MSLPREGIFLGRTSTARRLIRDIKKIISWADSRAVDVFFNQSEDCYMARSFPFAPKGNCRDVIHLSRRKSLRAIRNFLLHELGHHIIFYDTRIRGFFKFRSHIQRDRTRRSQHLLIKEELLAWDFGALIASGLNIKLDKYYWVSAAHALDSYVSYIHKRSKRDMKKSHGKENKLSW